MTLLSLHPIKTTAQWIPFSPLSIEVHDQSSRHVKKAVTVLQEELYKRSQLLLPVKETISTSSLSRIIVLNRSNTGSLAPSDRSVLQSMKPTKAEGYKIVSVNNKIIVLGHDDRGCLYGIGKLLREMKILPGALHVKKDLKISSSAAYAIRGHQLGYRPKTNAYDAWTVTQYDQYIRDLTIFGANSIEIVAPRTDDDSTSVHMKLSSMDMIREQSRICDAYGLDLWMWYPNMGEDYVSSASIRTELEEREKVFSNMPKLTAVFVPGGDPGYLEPDQLFHWLAQVAKVLNKYHPKAKIWVSAQAFRPSEKWYAKFFEQVNRKYPWFGGVVYGPWIKATPEEVRRSIDPSIPIRLYPDITHNFSSQYPVPDMDLTWAMTLGRESINPRPNDEKFIHNRYAALASGSISYSEGTNDDVNKFIWSDQDWDPSTPVINTLRDYVQYFIGHEYRDTLAQAILSLEQHLRGPLISNAQVQRTLQRWQSIEERAPDHVLSNPRFQNGLIRAYHDAYIQKRLLYENELEKQARQALSMRKPGASNEAIARAKDILSKAQREPQFQSLKERCLALADSLFTTFGAQLTIKKHHAAEGRGNFIDNIDIPLNDAPWLNEQMDRILALHSENERDKAIHAMLHRTDPGPGGIYDDLGSPASSKRTLAIKRWKDDPGGLRSPTVSYGVGLSGVDWVHEVVHKGFDGQATPLAWMNQIGTYYDVPLELQYDGLDSGSEYVIRIAYTGRIRSSVKLMAEGVMIHPYLKMGEQPIVEFPIPRVVTRDGKVRFTFSCAQQGEGEAEIGTQVGEIWLIKKKADQQQIKNGSSFTVANFFSDNMVLQRDKAIPVWGKGVPGKMITGKLGGQVRSAPVNKDSSWRLTFPPQRATASPLILSIASEEHKFNFNNVLIGDLWLCIGQSNMEWPVSKEIHYIEEKKESDQPLLRSYDPIYTGKNVYAVPFSDSIVRELIPENFYKGEWRPCDSSTFGFMSAVAYYFAKKVIQQTGVPVGLINLSIGGAPLETFIDIQTLRSSERFMSKTVGDWMHNDQLPVWIRERGIQNLKGVSNVSADALGMNHGYKPGFAYEAGINKILPMPIKGILCYQGESNAQEQARVDEYAALSALLVSDYRKKWNDPQMPFYYVQLSSIDTLNYKGHLWPSFRDEQRKMLTSIPHTGMAVSSDIGDPNDVHPTNKKPVGERLARWALHNTYHLGFIPSGPLPIDATDANEKVTIRFKYADGLKTSGGKEVLGFSVEGKSLSAVISNDGAIIIPVAQKPSFISYGWKPFSDGNLINGEGLPASTFKIKVND